MGLENQRDIPWAQKYMDDEVMDADGDPMDLEQEEEYDSRSGDVSTPTYKDVLDSRRL